MPTSTSTSTPIPIPTRMDRLRYRFDLMMARGVSGLVGALAMVTLVMVIVAATILVGLRIQPAGADSLGYGEALWQSLMHAFDPSAVGGSSGWAYRTVMFAVGIGGLFVLSALIGVLTTGLDGRLEALRKGRSRVVERDHTVVLGWAPSAFAVLGELAVANENRRSACVVVLAGEDKVAMEDAVRERVDLRGTRVVCRTGSALDPADLSLTCPERARAIIVLPPEGADGDVRTLKILMAIHRSRGLGVRCPVVAALRSPAMLEAARSLGDEATTLVLIDDILARMTAQSCRQRGLSAVYQELLDFEGDEIYFIPAGAATGSTYEEALHGCAGGTVMGLRTAEGRTRLAPPMDTRIGPEDQLIVIAADDGVAKMMPPADRPIDRARIQVERSAEAPPERTLILGWNHRGPIILRELDSYSAPGSSAVVASRADLGAELTTLAGGMEGLSVSHRRIDVVERSALEALEAASFDHVIILASEATDDVQMADARTLITLIHLRTLLATRSGGGASIVTEMLDVRNRDLADIARPDDFIVSDRLVSLLLTQIAEEPAVAAVFMELLDADGAELYLRSAADYVALGEPITFHTVIAAAAERGETAVGVALAGGDGDPSAVRGASDGAVGVSGSGSGGVAAVIGGDEAVRDRATLSLGPDVRLNPDKDAPMALRAGDRIVVVAVGES